MFSVKQKQASVTMEIVFAILLTLGVIFVSLGMYSDNIKNMMDNGGVQNVFNKTSAKTEYDKWGIDPTRNQITAPEVEATSWEAILAGYNDKAKTKIEEYYAQTQSGTVLTDTDKMDLAMWLAIYANSSKVGYGKTLLQNSPAGASWDYYGFGLNQNIDFSAFVQKYELTINSGLPSEKTISWDNSNFKTRGELFSTTDVDRIKGRVLNIRDGIIPAFK